jgi:hypothetical protein
VNPQNPPTSIVALQTLGQAVGKLWVTGEPQAAISSLSVTAHDPVYASPGMLCISPQAATHLGQSIATFLLASNDSANPALALATMLMASSEPGLRMIGPHILTPFVRRDATLTKQIADIATSCFDAASITALVIPLAAAVRTSPKLAGTSLSAASSKHYKLIDLVVQTVARGSLSTARQFTLAMQEQTTDER